VLGRRSSQVTLVMISVAIVLTYFSAAARLDGLDDRDAPQFGGITRDVDEQEPRSHAHGFSVRWRSSCSSCASRRRRYSHGLAGR